MLNPIQMGIKKDEKTIKEDGKRETLAMSCAHSVLGHLSINVTPGGNTRTPMNTKS